MMKSSKLIEGFIAKGAVAATKTNVNSACAFWCYQATVPDKAKLLKKM